MSLLKQLVPLLVLLCVCCHQAHAIRHGQMQQRPKRAHAARPAQLDQPSCQSSDSDTIRKGTGTCKAQTTPDDFGYCIPAYQSSCAAPANNQCRHCILYFEASDAAGVCKDTKHTPNSYCFTSGATTLQISTCEAEHSHLHWKVVPDIAKRGVEDMETVAALGVYDKLWQDGWHAAKTQNLPFNGKTPPSLGDFGLVINSAKTRRDHQMHIHIAKLDTTSTGAYATIPGAKVDPKTYSTTNWVKSTTSHGKDVAMLCPPTGTKLTPFTSMKSAITNKHWAPNKWHTTTIAVISPPFCTGAPGSCSWCQLLLDDVGDQQLLYYPRQCP